MAQDDRPADLKPFFEPCAVAVFGSMRQPLGEGLTVVRNMLDFGFTGKIYPISRSSTEILGLKAYADIETVDDRIDLGIVVTPPQTVPHIIEQCGRKGIRAVIVATEGFAEVGPEGASLQRQLVEVARHHGVRILGPNTLGVLNMSNCLITDPYPIGRNKPRRGGVSYSSQTGLLTFGVHPIKDKAYPISKVFDFGNKCDINELDLLWYLANDPETRVIVMHLEDVKDGRRFIELARRVVARKPVLIFKTGRSEAGARAVSSHTGSLAGNDQVYDSAFRQAGIIRLKTWHEFWEIPRTLSMQPLPKGNRIAIVTATGGAGVILIDAATECGLRSAAFTPSTVAKLDKLSPRLTRNPVDVGPLMSLRESPFDIYEEVLPVVLEDPDVDCVTCVCHLGKPIVEVFSRLVHQISKIGKPVTIFGYGIDLGEMEESARQLEAMGLPTYLDLETAVKALGIGATYLQVKTKLEEDSKQYWP